VKSIDYHPTGDSLLSSDVNGNIKIWDAQKCIKTFPGFTYKSEIDALFLATVAWNPDETSFAFPGTNKNVRIFKSENSAPWSLDDQHTSNVITLAWSPNGRYLASSADDNSFVIWDLNTRKSIVMEITSAQITGIAWSFTENEITIVKYKLHPTHHLLTYTYDRLIFMDK
jgi:chromosome transmission fidelity protein 4